MVGLNGSSDRRIAGPRLIAVVGPFQGGKTTLLDYAASHAGPMRVLRATGIEAENEFGFAGLY